LSGLAVPIIPPKEAKQAEPQPNWADVGSLPQDYVKGLKESEKTALNTKEYVFYGYFQRIRERLDRAWVPILREKLVKLWRTGRQLASDMDHTTQVLVILNKTGEIVRVQVVSESGTGDLDDAAVRAFNQAGPFPNPPKGIIDPNGEIQIPWQFVLKT
jgi:protein TonB